MKLFFVALCVVAATADRLENTYLPPSSAKTAGGSGSFLNAPRPSLSGPRIGGSISGSGSAGSYSQSSGPTAAPIAILRLNNDNNGDGAYKFEFETENRISASESGQLKNAGTDAETTVVQGSYTYTGDDGQTYTVNYIADENGFQPQGAHLPVAPAIPEEILKALEQNAADEAAGIVDDGQYRPEHQGPTGGRTGGAAGGSRQYLAPKPSNQQGGYRY